MSQIGAHVKILGLSRSAAHGAKKNSTEWRTRVTSEAQSASQVEQKLRTSQNVV